MKLDEEIDHDRGSFCCCWRQCYGLVVSLVQCIQCSVGLKYWYLFVPTFSVRKEFTIQECFASSSEMNWDELFASWFGGYEEYL